ncbi:MAG: PAS domain S-box protein [Methanocalculus sp.]|uniref:PAS domain S-box protein n=1 Tax=Methanocalculus sp. TaxID=2004547 RepID=UPI0027278174|nr:PAS domain S-box protein [Methanocalculus sp.]MDO8842613.1 PAS domain S-box protein [Methanocalculus sp.]MDO9539432.1 PAS domain S-box protein [Methanocalculus sp.]
MSEEDKKSRDLSELRRRAEEIARHKAESFAQDSASLSASEVRKTLHELKVHQIELEMQNEELRATLVDLDASRAQYFELYDLAPVGYCTVNEKGLILEANLTVVNLLGKSGRAAFLRQPITRFIHTEDQDIYYMHRKLLFENSGIQGCELRMMKEDGTHIWVYLQATSVQEKDGEQIYRVILSDITDRKVVEEALKENENRLQLALFGSETGMWELHIPTMEVVIDERACNILGYEHKGTRSYHTFWDTLLQPEKNPLVDKRLVAYITGKTPFFEVESQMKHSSGSMVWMIIRGKITRSLPDGSPLQLSGTFHDITEQKLTEEALYVANKKLKILSSITRHDILNKIMGVNGYLWLSRDLIQDENLLRYFHNIENAITSIEKQIEFTHTYEELGMKKPEWFQISELIKKLSDPLIRIKHDCMNLNLLADPMIEKVFYNLMGNTIAHAEGATMVQIHCEILENDLLIIWEDDGPGIPDDQKEQIFEKGFGKHTGFGLFLSREILSITGLHIRETGIFGKGARFEIRVPKGMWSAFGDGLAR